MSASSGPIAEPGGRCNKFSAEGREVQPSSPQFAPRQPIVARACRRRKKRTQETFGAGVFQYVRYFVVIPPRKGDGATLYRELDTSSELQPDAELFLDELWMRVEELGPGVAGADATVVCVPVERELARDDRHHRS